VLALPPVTVGKHQQRDPYPEFGEDEERVSATDPAQRRIAECKPEHSENRANPS